MLLGACAGEPRRLPALPSIAAGQAAPATVLGADTTTLDDVAQPLDRLGFVGGRERVYVGAAGTFERTVTRALAFETQGGADGYLRWLGDHASAIIGTASAVTTDLGPGAVTFAHAPGGCCPGKDVPAFLLAWRAGTRVLVVDARGKTMALERAVAIAEELERSG